MLSLPVLKTPILRMGNLKEENFNIYFQPDSAALVRESATPKIIQHKDSAVVDKSEKLGGNTEVKVSSNFQTSSRQVLGTDRVSYSNDTIFELSSLGSFDFTLRGQVFSERNYSNNLFKVTTPLISKRESDSYNAFSGKVFVESTESKLVTVNSREKLINHFPFNSWLLFGLILLLSSSLILFRRYNEKFFGLILLSAFNIREAGRFFISKTNLYQQILAITNTLFVSSICLAVFNYLTLVSPTFDSSVKSFVIIAAVVIGYLLYRNILILLFSMVSNLREFFSTLSFHHFIFNFIITLFLLFFGVLSTYLPFEFRVFPLYASLIIVIILFILRTIRTLRLFILNRFSIFYWFLYFCALELVPLAFLFYGFKRLVIIA